MYHAWTPAGSVRGCLTLPVEPYNVQGVPDRCGRLVPHGAQQFWHQRRADQVRGAGRAEPWCGTCCWLPPRSAVNSSESP